MVWRLLSLRYGLIVKEGTAQSPSIPFKIQLKDYLTYGWKSVCVAKQGSRSDSDDSENHSTNRLYWTSTWLSDGGLLFFNTMFVFLNCYMFVFLNVM